MSRKLTPLQSGGSAHNDPKRILRHFGSQKITTQQILNKPPPDSNTIDESILCATLAAGLLDPVNRVTSDNMLEALSHFNAIAQDAQALYKASSDKVTENSTFISLEKALYALRKAIHEQSGYHGATQDYDDLKNANMFRVMERRCGLPVALGIIYMHIGRTLGLTVQGLSFPGHFLLRIQSGSEHLIIDPYLGGISRNAADLRALLKNFQGNDAELSPIHYAPVEDQAVLLRVQNNIKIRLLQNEQPEKALEILEIMLMIDPKEPTLWRESGVINASIGSLRAAITALQNCLAFDPQTPQKEEIEAFITQLIKRIN